MILVSFYARCINKILSFINREFYSRIFNNAGIIAVLYI